MMSMALACFGEAWS